MDPSGMLSRLGPGIRFFLASFVLVLSVGFFTGLRFVGQTGSTQPAGIETNYLGNEEDEDAEVMIFKKSPREMLTIIHSHILSMSTVFLLLGILVWMTRLPVKLKMLLTIEPFFSVLFTFGGIYFLWQGALWWKYVVFCSGILMTLTFLAAAVLVLLELLRPNKG